MGFEHDVETKVNTGGGGGGAAMFTFVSTPKANLGAALRFQYRPMGTPSHLIVDSLTTSVPFHMLPPDHLMVDHMPY